jgi:hypothetical protein
MLPVTPDRGSFEYWVQWCHQHRRILEILGVLVVAWLVLSSAATGGYDTETHRVLPPVPEAGPLSDLSLCALFSFIFFCLSLGLRSSHPHASRQRERR